MQVQVNCAALVQRQQEFTLPMRQISMRQQDAKANWSNRLPLNGYNHW